MTICSGSIDALEEAALDVVNVYNGKVTRIEDVVPITYSTSRIPMTRCANRCIQRG